MPKFGDAQVQQILINPFGSITFVAGNSDWPRRGLTAGVGQVVGRHQDRVDNGRLMNLAAGQMEAERVPQSVGEQMQFRRKTAARTT